jgi:TolB-like protein
MRLLLLALALAAPFLALPARGAAPSPDAGPRVKPVVAVLYFDMPESGEKAAELADLKKGLAELIISDLVAGDQVTVVERSRLEAVLGELNLQASGKVDPATAQRVGKLLGAKYLVWGSLTLVPFVKTDPASFKTRVVVVETSALKQRSHRGSLENFYELQAAMSVDAAEQIAELEQLAPPPPPQKAGRPSFNNAVRYSRALDAKDKKDPAKAKQLLVEVIKDQPDSKLAQLAQLDLLNLSK